MSTPSGPQYALGQILRGDDGATRFATVGIEVEAYEAIVDAVDVLQRMGTDLLFETLMNEFRTLRSSHRVVATVRSLRLHPTRGQSPGHQFGLYTAIASWLNAFYMFTQYADIECKHSRVPRLTSRSYDRSLAYNVCYKVRNLMVHGEFPPFSERLGPRRADDPKWMHQRFTLYLDRDALEEAFDRRDVSSRPDLSSFEPTFEFMPLVLETMGECRRIQRDLIHLRGKAAESAARRVLEAVEQISDRKQGGQPVVCRMIFHGQKATLSPTPLPVSQAEELVAVAERGEPPELDELGDDDGWTAKVRRVAAADDRVGLRLLAEYLALDEIDELTFWRTASDLISTSDDLWACVADLLNASSVLADVSARQLSTTPSDLLSLLCSVTDPPMNT